MKKTLDGRKVHVSSSMLSMSSVKDTRDRQVFRGTFDPDNDHRGVLIFIDFFPEESFPHLCRYIFVRDNGYPEVVDSIFDPSLDIHFRIV